jgi:hypothetical protein
MFWNGILVGFFIGAFSTVFIIGIIPLLTECLKRRKDEKRLCKHQEYKCF